MNDPRPARNFGPGAAGFTLIETMLAVLLLALLASSVVLSFSKPLQDARGRDTVDLFVNFDAAARQSAAASGWPVRIQFDLTQNVVQRLEGPNLVSARAKNFLPAGYRVDQVRIGRRTQSFGPVSVDVSAHGWSRSYAVHVVGPGLDTWLCFAGLTGLMKEVPDAASLPAPPPGYDTD